MKRQYLLFNAIGETCEERHILSRKKRSKSRYCCVNYANVRSRSGKCLVEKRRLLKKLSKRIINDR